jgi:hypothetical protein
LRLLPVRVRLLGLRSALGEATLLRVPALLGVATLLRVAARLLTWAGLLSPPGLAAPLPRLLRRLRHRVFLPFPWRPHRQVCELPPTAPSSVDYLTHGSG